jgi:SagB-type dehydrogenase family enzyme
MRTRIRVLALLVAGLPSLARATSGPSDPALPQASSSAAPAAERYRRATRHTPASVRGSRHELDWSNKPPLYRSYAGAPTLALPAPAPLHRAALAAIATPMGPVTGDPRVLDRRTLGTILFFAGGITGLHPSSGTDLRATASAGALYPNELYVVAGPLPDLEAGVYHYDPKAHALALLRSGDWRPALASAAADDAVRAARGTVVLTGILWRSAWKYGERGYRHLLWDGGMVLANLLAAADGAGLTARTLGAFVDGDVDRLVGADGRFEKSLALVPLGVATAPMGAPPPPPDIPALSVRPSPPSAAPRDHPEALRYHAASRLADATAVRALRSAKPAPATWPTTDSLRGLPAPASARGDPGVDAVIRRRRSARRFARRPIAGAELAAVLERTTHSASADFLSTRPTLLEIFVIVNAVDGIPPGSYRYDRKRDGLVPLASGDFRSVAGFLCLDQALARDASAVLFYLSDLDAIGRAFGERGYRFAEMEAGLLAGRAYLAAYATGRGATGLTFYDDEVRRFFSPPAAGLEALLVVAVGVPHRSR